MNNVWWIILGIMVAGGILKYFFVSPLIALAINIVVLIACYLVLRRYPYVDMKRSMLFLVVMTLLVSLVELGLISGLIANIAMLGLIAWMFFGLGRRPQRPARPRHPWHK